jgi:DNA-binding transcriptional LysR family regulator
MFKLMNMKPQTPPRFFEEVRMFVVSARSRNFLEASRELGISQAALSLHLRELEAQLPAPLFELQGRKKELSRFGREFLNAASEALDHAESTIQSCVDRYRNEADLVLRIGARPDLFATLASKLKFKGHIEFVSLTGDAAARAVLEKRVDLAVTYHKPDSTEIVAKKAFMSGLVLVWKDPKVSEKTREPSAEWFREATAVSIDTRGSLLEDFLRSKGLKWSALSRRRVVDDWRSLIELLEELPTGYAVIPDFLKLREKSLRRFALPTKPLQYYYLHARSLSKIDGFAGVLKSLNSQSPLSI